MGLFVTHYFDIYLCFHILRTPRTALSDCDALTRQNEQMWNMASEEVRHDYGETYFRSFLTKLKYVLRFSRQNLREVVADLVHSVTSAYPYTRYVPVLFGAQLPSDTFALTPNLFEDFVLTTLLKGGASPSCASPHRSLK